jgi:hypothetical protein
VSDDVERLEVEGGFAWRCRSCGGSAGLPAGLLRPESAVPFTDAGQRDRAAAAHAGRCAGADSKSWRRKKLREANS